MSKPGERPGFRYVVDVPSHFDVKQNVEDRRAHYLNRWHDLGAEFTRQKNSIIRRTRALANFMQVRSMTHLWRVTVEAIEVEGLGTKLQFQRSCVFPGCPARQHLIEWWHAYKEVCY